MQAREFGVERVVIGDERYYTALKDALKDTNIEVLAGSDAILDIARDEHCDTIVNSLVGYSGLHPTYAPSKQVSVLPWQIRRH